MRIYKYLYYKLYCLWLKKKDEPENAYINAVISISLLIGFNLASIPLVMMALFGRNMFVNFEFPPNWIIYILVILFGISQYFLLAHKGRYLKIIDEFKNESEIKRKKSLLYTWVYIIITIGIPFFIVLVSPPR